MKINRFGKKEFKNRTRVYGYCITDPDMTGQALKSIRIRNTRTNLVYLYKLK